MNREPIRTGYTLLIGVAILGLWRLFYATEQIPELATDPYEIGYHLAAETPTALALITAGAGSFDTVRGSGASIRLLSEWYCTPSLTAQETTLSAGSPR